MATTQRYGVFAALRILMNDRGAHSVEKQTSVYAVKTLTCQSIKEKNYYKASFYF